MGKNKKVLGVSRLSLVLGHWCPYLRENNVICDLTWDQAQFERFSFSLTATAEIGETKIEPDLRLSVIYYWTGARQNEIYSVHKIH